MTVLVTGAGGFIGSNLCLWLRRVGNHEVVEIDIGTPDHIVREGLERADCVVHLAGINRPETVDEFQTGNVDLTSAICNSLANRKVPANLIFSSSTQAERDNPYGRSKLAAEQLLREYAKVTNVRVVAFRLTNVFGKWCRPNYNSAVATFCHNIARELPITISDPRNEIDLVYIDDVCRCILDQVSTIEPTGFFVETASPSHTISLGRLAELIKSFRQSRTSLMVPDLHEPFVRQLYGTYVSYLRRDDFAYELLKYSDDRGALAEFIKTPGGGQIFVSRTAPGITRGNHSHHTKTEKFLVLEGDAIVRFRHVGEEEVLEYPISGRAFRVIDIPPGYVHSIENVGFGDLVTLFWASEVFDKEYPDTFSESVIS